MADIKIELKPEDVNKAIADAIIKSTMGDVLTKMVNEYVIHLTRSYDNPVKKLIEDEVKLIIQQMVAERAPVIREIVTAQLADDLTDKLIKTAMEKMLKGIY